MELKEIRQIVKLMEEHGLSYFHLTHEGVDLKLKKGMDLEGFKELLSAMPNMQVSGTPAAAHAPAPVAAAPTTGENPAPAEPAKDGDEITAPIVGTFYRKPDPESDNFVEVGTQVNEGQVLCIIEAMKVMNEIKAERSGKITEIIADDASPVQYGDPLFRIS